MLALRRNICSVDQERIEDFVQKLKAMQWLALKVRFVEPLKNNNHTDDHRDTKRYLAVTANRQHASGYSKHPPHHSHRSTCRKVHISMGNDTTFATRRQP